MPRFFINAIHASPNQEISLDDDVYHHWCKVLRAKVGDTAVLFDGQGGEYQVQLTDITKKSATVRICDYIDINRTPPFDVTLGLVMSRGDRMDYAIQKATEMGVFRIQLLTSERCQEHLKYERDQKKLTHWQNIATAACEQCGLNIIPQILKPMTLQEWASQCTSDLKLVMAVSDTHATPRHIPQDVAILVGAEGGLSDAELDFVKSHGFIAWTIGERVLRTETAPVVALSALQILYAIQ